MIAFCFRGVYFPASGYRQRVVGGFTNLAFSGLSWSSSSRGIDSVDGAYVGFDYVLMCPLSNGDCRASGCPVRCVQELNLA